jgi:hypothetical protein
MDIGATSHTSVSPLPLHFKHSHWWKRRSRSKFVASHYAWGANGVCECKMDVKSAWNPNMALNGSCVDGHLDNFQKSPLGGRPNTKPGDHGTPNAHNCWFILFYHARRTAWIGMHWTSIWFRAQSQMTSRCTWGSMPTLDGFGGVLGRPLDTFFWALTISWSWL